MAQLVKNPPAMQETWVQSLGWEDPMEKGTATIFGIDLENSMDCIVHGVTKNLMQLSDFYFHRMLASFLGPGFCCLVLSHV